jgi:hypothetical protein
VGKNRLVIKEEKKREILQYIKENVLNISKRGRKERK